jgi:hypothetical protein
MLRAADGVVFGLCLPGTRSECGNRQKRNQEAGWKFHPSFLADNKSV